MIDGDDDVKIVLFIYICSNSEAIEVIWPIIRQQLMGGIRTRGHPELNCLRQVGEKYGSWIALEPEDILLRWVNFHLETDVLEGFDQEEVQ